MKKSAIVIALILAGIAAFFWFSKPSEPVVTITTLSHGNVNALVANTRAGTVRSCRRSKLSLAAGGTVAKLYVSNGDRVKQGQILLHLWNKDQQARVEQAEAQLHAAQLNIDVICEASARDQRDAKRAKTLAYKKVISEDALDAAITQAGISAHSCQRAQVEVTAAEAQAKLQNALLQQTQLIAPFDGIVAEINGEVGEYVTPSPPGIVTPPAVDLIADDCMYVRAPIDEVDAADIKVGMPAQITLDAFRNQTFSAVVTRIAPYVQDYEKQARTVDVEARFEPIPDAITLLVGYSADIEIILQQQNEALRIPTEAVFDINHVMLLNDDNRLENREFKKGLSNWTWTEAITGLKAGDRIVLSLDTPGAEPGAQVNIAP